MRFAIVAGLVAIPGVALAGDDGTAPLNPLDPVQVVSPVSIVQGDGVKVGEGTSIYPQIGLETGFVSNVFYTHDNQVGAGLLRVIAEVGAGSLSPQRRRAFSPDSDVTDDPEDLAEETATDAGTTGAFQYSANLYATWEQYLSDNDAVTDQGGLGVGAYLRGIVHPGRPLNLFGIESFDRVLRAANFETPVDTNRDINSLTLALNYQPAGRSLSGTLTYSNVVDVFEEDQFRFSDRMLNTLALRLNWRVLPYTMLHAQVSEGFNTGLGSSSVKVNSYPLVAALGINTALTEKLAVAARIGYTQGFYESGPDYGTVVGGAYLDYRYSPLGRFRFLYSYEHADSINANFYRDHVVQAWFEQRVNPISVFVSPVLRLRHYEGVIGGGMNTDRDDTIGAIAAGFRYDLRNWIIVTAEYRLTADQTDYRYFMAGMPGPDLSYIRHEVLAGVRVAY
jgi:hypothetical protein